MTEIVLYTKARQSQITTTKTINIDIPVVTGIVEIMLDLNPIEAIDKSLSLWFHVYELIDGKQHHIAGAQWKGGSKLDSEFNDRNPRLWIPADRLSGQTIYVEVNDPKGQKIGYRVSIK